MTRPLCQWIQSFWYVFTWYLEMIVKSAALSSNQAVGVKKSLRFGVQVLQTLNRALYEDFILFLSSFFTNACMKTLDWQVRLLQLVPSWEGQNGRRTPLVKCFYVSLGGKFSNPHTIPPRECTLLLVLPQPRWTWCLVGSRKSRWVPPKM